MNFNTRPAACACGYGEPGVRRCPPPKGTDKSVLGRDALRDTPRLSQVLECGSLAHAVLLDTLLALNTVLRVFPQPKQ